MKWVIIDEDLKEVMDMAGSFNANTEEEAANTAITLLDFGYEARKTLKTTSATKVLADLGYSVAVENNIVVNPDVIVCDNRTFKV